MTDDGVDWKARAIAADQRLEKLFDRVRAHRWLCSIGLHLWARWSDFDAKQWGGIHHGVAAINQERRCLRCNKHEIRAVAMLRELH